MNKKFAMNMRISLLRRNANCLKVFLMFMFFSIVLIIPIKAQTTYNFDRITDLKAHFNPSENAKMSNDARDGLKNSGCVNILRGDKQFWTAKKGIKVQNKGTYIVSAYFYNSFNNGYGGIGFTVAHSNQSGQNDSGGPAIGLGMVFHGGKGAFVNNDIQTTDEYWRTDQKDLKLDCWYKVVYKLIALGENKFNEEFQIWESDKNGNIIFPIWAIKTATNITNKNIGELTDLYPYFSSGYMGSVNAWRFTKIDNFYSNIAPKTTLDETIVPDNVPVTPLDSVNGPGSFTKYGYGKSHLEAGLPYQKRVDLMPVGYKYDSYTPKMNLLRFFTISDIHITDKQSPAQAIYFRRAGGNNAISIYSPLMLYTTQVLDASIQTINDLHEVNPFNFGLALGDLANSTQKNELRWFIDVLDGKEIHPYSGSKNDTTLDYQKSYLATGLNKNIEWYATIGNHDHFWIGSKPVSAKLRKAYIGDSILRLGNIFDFNDPYVMDKDIFATGVLDGETKYGDIIGEGRNPKVKVVSADTNRRSLLKSEWISEFNTTTTFPKGHGFASKDAFGACYSFIAKNTIYPIKVIVLDDTQDDKDKPYSEGIYGHGELDTSRYNWLVTQLESAKENKQLVIISAHVPIGVAPKGSAMDWVSNKGYINDSALICKLNTYPNILLWVSGHRHLNVVTAFPDKTKEKPENGFWEVETKSLREFPEQLRTFDIVLNSDNTISIFTTNVDPYMPENSAAAIGRSYAIASNQIYGLNEAPLPTGSVSYNAELIKPLSPEIKENISRLFDKKQK